MFINITWRRNFVLCSLKGWVEITVPHKVTGSYCHLNITCMKSKHICIIWSFIEVKVITMSFDTYININDSLLLILIMDHNLRATWPVQRTKNREMGVFYCTVTCWWLIKIEQYQSVWCGWYFSQWILIFLKSMWYLKKLCKTNL